MRRRPPIAALFCAVLAFGCALGPPLAVPPGVVERREVAGVPFFGQEEQQCGPAALAMALAWSGLSVTPAEIAPMVYTPGRRGSLQPDMIAAARRLGRVAYVIQGEAALVREIASGHPVIVLQNLGLAWAPAWHYAVAIGYDRAAEEILLHTGLTPRRATPLALFRATWSRSRDWGLLVLPPESLPAAADESRFVEAVVGLEQAGRLPEAAEGYRTALRRWPQNLTAMMGLGNCRYHLGDLAGAEEAFRRAAAAHPESGAAWNNLAHVLAARGDKAAALEAARRAVALGGPLRGTFEKTLQEIGAPPLP